VAVGSLIGWYRYRANSETVRHIQIHRASLTRTEPPVPIREAGIVVGFAEPDELVGDFTSDIQAELDKIEAEAAELPYTMMTDDEWESL
jgi:hypothetical protein